MKEPFLNSDQVLNQVFDRENKLLKTSATGGGGVGRSSLPIAAWRSDENFGDFFVEDGDEIFSMVVDCSE